MAKKGRPKKSAYEKYETAYDRAKSIYKGSWFIEEKLDKTTFDNVINTNISEKQAIKDIIDKQKYGRLSKEIEGRRDFYETTIKKINPKAKWSTIKFMSHAEFIDTYGNEIKDIYDSYINSGYAPNEIKELISQYVFGSE